jgi:hypothetical protein
MADRESLLKSERIRTSLARPPAHRRIPLAFIQRVDAQFASQAPASRPSGVCGALYRRDERDREGRPRRLCTHDDRGYTTIC